VRGFLTCPARRSFTASRSFLSRSSRMESGTRRFNSRRISSSIRRWMTDKRYKKAFMASLQSMVASIGWPEGLATGGSRRRTGHTRCGPTSRSKGRSPRGPARRFYLGEERGRFKRGAASSGQANENQRSLRRSCLASSGVTSMS